MKKKIGLLSLLLVIFSCEKYFGDVNTDPDQPLNVPPNVVIGGIEGTLAYAYGGDLSRYTGIFTQHCNGGVRQWTVIHKYGIVGEDVNTLWINLYANVLVELDRLKANCEENGYKHYLGVAKILEAYTLLLIIDNWNDAPYSEAFKGDQQLQPTFDSQDDIYQTVFDLLSSAKTDLAETNGGGIVPGSEELIFGGDLSAWNGFANFVEARAHLHRGKKDPANYQKALNAVNAGDLTADCAFPFTKGINDNPAFQFNEQREDCLLGSKLQSLVNNLNDPRKNLYDQPFDAANTLFTADRNVNLGPLVEQKFIEAECIFQISGAAAAHPLYLEAIGMSMSFM